MCTYTLPPSQCAPGAYGKSAHSNAQCKVCSAGKFSAAAASSCINCPAAKTTNAGQSVCSKCPAGLVATKPGSSACISCPTGKTALPWQTGCTKWGTQLKKHCKSNRFKESFKTYAVAQAVCLQQGPACSGVYNPESAGVSDKFYLCKLGSFEVSNVADIIFTKPLSVCRAGTYGSLAATKQAQCKACKVGRFALSGSTGCGYCKQGTFAASNSAAKCVQCPSFHYTDDFGATECKKCPAGKVAGGGEASHGATSCLDGLSEASFELFADLKVASPGCFGAVTSVQCPQVSSNASTVATSAGMVNVSAVNVNNHGAAATSSACAAGNAPPVLADTSVTVTAVLKPQLPCRLVTTPKGDRMCGAGVPCPVWSLPKGAQLSLYAQGDWGTATLKDSIGGVWSYGNGGKASVKDNVQVMDLNAGNIDRYVQAPVVGQNHTTGYWLWWRECDTCNGQGWRTLFRGDKDHWAIVQTGNTNLGFFSNRSPNNGWRDTGYDLTGHKSGWQLVIAVGQGDSETSFTGKTTF